MISKIEEDFYRITLRMPYRLRHVNAYLLAHHQELALFDTGLNTPAAYETLIKDLSGAGFSVSDIKQIYLTHVHTDHCSMAGLLQEESGARVHLSREAFEEYRHFRQTGPTIGQLKKFYARQGMPSHLIDLVIEEYEDIGGIIAEFQADTFLRDKEICEFGHWKFEVVATPGHAAGHVCFFFREKGLLLAGDHILPYIAPILSPDIFDDDLRPLATYLNSLNVIETLPVRTIYPGHGMSFVDLNDRLADIREQHRKKKLSVLECVQAHPQTAYDIANEVSRADLSDFDKFLSLNETISYLKELKAENAIRESAVSSVLVYSRA